MTRFLKVSKEILIAPPFGKTKVKQAIFRDTCLGARATGANVPAATRILVGSCEGF